MRAALKGKNMENKFKVTQSLKDAIVRAATDAGSFEQLGRNIDVPPTILQLVADGQFEEISFKTLSALMPKIMGYLPGNEKKAVIKFLSPANMDTSILSHSATFPHGHLVTNMKGQNNG